MHRQTSKDVQIGTKPTSSRLVSNVNYSNQLYYQNNEGALNEQYNELGYPESLIVEGH